MPITTPLRLATLSAIQLAVAALLLGANLDLAEARELRLSMLTARPIDAASPALKPSDAMSRSGTRPLFDMETVPIAEGEILDKWQRVRSEIARELEAMNQCHASSPCAPAAQRLIDISAEGAGKSGRARVGLINRAVNLALVPTSDERQWGVADHWSAPFETLQSSRGDCEDYAIVKYIALLDAGVPADEVKIVVLRSMFPREDHAAVAAKVDGEWLILDNRKLTLVRDTDLVRVIPEYVLDQEGARRLVWSNQSRRRIADAG
jgi:predicted transglutaminase-like cysteine proteinase